eukprot:4996150-Pyramimonas_sp.AAC.1
MPKPSRAKIAVPELTPPPSPKMPGHQVGFQPSFRADEEACAMASGSKRRCSWPRMIDASDDS